MDITFATSSDASRRAPRCSWRVAAIQDLVADVSSSAMAPSEVEELAAQTEILAQLLRQRAARPEPEVLPSIGSSLRHAPMCSMRPDELKLILDQVGNADAVAMALTCRAFRDVALTRWPSHSQRYSFRFESAVSHHVTSVPRLQWAVDTFRCPRDANTCRAAAAAGALEVLQHLRTSVPPCPWDARTCEAAARHGHEAVLVWLRSTLPPAERCPWDARTAAAAARGGHLELLRWARQRRCPWDPGTSAAAASEGHVAVLEWCRKRGCPWDEEVFYQAEAGGHASIIDWALEHDCPSDNVDFGSEAALHGDTATLTFLHEHTGVEMSHPQTLWVQGCASGKVDVLRWLRDKEYPLRTDDPEPCVTAADRGDLASLQFLHETMRCTWNVGVCNAAAQRGDLALLKYAHEHGCPWGRSTFKAAGDPGPFNDTDSYDENDRATPLEIIQYLHKEGCPWHSDALLYTGRDVAAWAKTVGLPDRQHQEGFFQGDGGDDGDGGHPFEPPFGPHVFLHPPVGHPPPGLLEHHLAGAPPPHMIPWHLLNDGPPMGFF